MTKGIQRKRREITSDGFRHFWELFGKGRKERENICGLWPHGPSLRESQASKVVAHGGKKVSEANALTGELAYS